jgi:hypothetical protein
MIEFHCWYCNRRHSMPESRIGGRITCSCQYPLCVPKRSGGKCRVKTLVDWLVQAAAYGVGGGLLGCGLALLLLTFGGGFLVLVSYRWLCRCHVVPGGWQADGLAALFPTVFAAFTLIGFLIGLFGGERGINWIGRLIRKREER